MVKKARIIVEKYDDGITVRWSDVDGNEPPVNRVAYSCRESHCIGSEIWKDLQYHLGESEFGKAIINLEYESV